MDHKTDSPDRIYKQKRWLHLGAAPLLAILLTALILFIPIGLSTVSPTINSTAPGWLSALNPGLIQAAGSLTITKSANVTEVNHGGFITFTLTITNNGDEDINSLGVSDDVPENTNCAAIQDPAFDSSGGRWAGDQAICDDEDTAQWTYLYIPPIFSNPGESFAPTEYVKLSYRVAVTEPLEDQSQIINPAGYAVIRLDTNETFTGTTPVAVTVNAPKWDINKTSEPADTVEPGDLITYTITYTNIGHYQTEGVYTITDVLPDNTSYVSGEGDIPSSMNGSLSWGRSTDLLPDQFGTITFVVEVTKPLTNNLSIDNNTYRIEGGNVFTPAIGAPVTLTVNSPITMTIGKSDDPFDPVQAGDLLTYTITLTNGPGSTGAATDLVFTDTIPANTSWVSAGTEADAAATVNRTGDTAGSVVTWTITTPTNLPVSGSVDLTMTVRVTTPLTNGTVITNSDFGITSASVPIAGVIGQLPITTTVESAPEITLTKSVTPTSVAPGGQVTYTITITNNGNGPAVDIPITDTLPTGFSPASKFFNRTIAGEGGFETIILTATAGTDAGDFGNVVTATVGSVNVTIGPVATVTVRPPIDLQISKARVGTGDVVVGDLITYTLTITNDFGSGNETAVVTDTIVNGKLDSFNISNYLNTDCTAGTPTLDCEFENFTNTTVITVVVDTTNSISGVITNTAFITNTDGLIDSPTDNNSSQITTSVRYPRAELSVSKVRTSSDNVVAGSPITYTITITSEAGSDPIDVVVTDTFDTAGASVANCDTGAVGSCTGTDPVVWTVENFSGGSSAVITLTLNSLETFSDTLTNDVEIAPVLDNVIENDSGDNTASVDTAVRYPTADLQIDKQRVGSSDVLAGDLVTFTVTITNPTSYDPVDVEVTDTPENGSIQSISGACTGTPCQIANLLGTETITVVVKSNTFTGTLTNTAVITFQQPAINVEDNPGDETAEATVTVRYPTADLQIDKQRVGSGDVLAGDPVTFTVTITNPTSYDPVDVEVTDTPDNGSIQTISGAGCTASPCQIANLLGTETITVVVKSDTFPGTLTNTAVITFQQPAVNVEDNPGDETAEATVAVRYPTADLQIDKQRVGSSDVLAGDLVTFTITITNPTGSGYDHVDVKVTDTPENGSIQSISGSGSPICMTDFCLYSSLLGTETITVVVSSDTFTGTLTNTAVITFQQPAINVEDKPGDETANATVAVRYPIADLQIDKQRVGSGDVLAGELVTFTITITNPTGSSYDPVDVKVTDTPENGSIQSIFGSGSPMCMTDFCLYSSLLGTETITVVVKSNTFTGTLTNTAVITFQQPAVNVEDNPGDETAEATVLVRYPTADLQIDKQRVGSGDVLAGDLVTFTVTITNAGPDTVDVEVTDTFTASEASVANCDTGSVGSLQGCTGTGPVIWTINDVSSGQTEVMTVTLTTQPTFSGTLTNTATITSTTPNWVDPDPNNTDNASAPVYRLSADLEVVKSGPARVVGGNQIVYTLAITNNGPDTVNAVLTDTFIGSSGTDVTVASAEPTPQCSASFPVVCNFTGFTTGSRIVTVTFNTNAIPTASDSFTLTNIAEIQPSALNVEDTAGNNTSEVETLVDIERVDLQINKARVGSDPVDPGDTITFTVIITNAGLDPADFVVVDTLTQGNISSVSAPGCTVLGLTAFCEQSQFTGTKTITVQMTTSSTPGLLTNQADIRPTLSGTPIVTDSVTVLVGTADLTIVKSASPDSGQQVTPGNIIDYTVIVQNAGGAAATNVSLTDLLDSSVTYVPGSGSSNGDFIENGGQITVNLASLSSGAQSLTATWRVTVTDVASGTVIENSAQASSNGTPVIQSNLVTHTVITEPAVSSDIYLPIVLKNCCSPNLVIENFSISGNIVTVVIKNEGLGATESGFWVDLYVNPSTLPENLSGSDRKWQNVSSYGIAWPVSGLAAGESRTLISSSGFDAGETNWPPPSGTYQIYSFVDSFATEGDSWVEIKESDETDNQTGPISYNSTGSAEVGGSGGDTDTTPRRDLSQ